MSVLRNIIAFLVLAAIVYAVSNYYGIAQQTVGVKGASTEKAQEVSNEIQSDIGKQAEKAADSASDVTVGDIFGFLQRFQKIPQDLQNAREYSEDQLNNFTNREK